jgi:hypothetical protein
LEHATIDLTDDEHVAVTAAIKLAIEATPAPNVKLNARIVGSRRMASPSIPSPPDPWQQEALEAFPHTPRGPF